MPKKDQSQSQDQPQNQSEEQPQEQSSQTDIHVETHTEQSVSSGGVTVQPDDNQVAELTADLQRLQAEFINFRRRAESEKAEVLNFAKARIAREFLTVRDSFDAEAAHRPKDADAGWAKSIDAIRTQFDQVLNNLGITRFQSVGQPFDPHRHEAVAHDGEGDHVVEELQPGYEIAGTVLRPAMVKVGPAANSK
jgi:molecular chaperone GrpE